MKYALVADVHVDNFRKYGGPVVGGVNKRGRAVLGSLRSAYNHAKNAKCNRFIVRGDLFHSSSPSPQLITQVASIVAPPPMQAVPVMETDFLVGNHDQVSLALNDHALAPFSFMGIQVIEGTSLHDDGDLAFVPFRPGDTAEWLEEEMSNCQGASLLGLHLGIFDDATAPYLQKCEDAVSYERLTELCDKFDIGDVVAGNWHQGRKWEDDTRTMVIPGALSPTGFADLGNKTIGRMIIWDDGEFTIKTVPGIRFMKYSLKEFKERDIGRSATHYYKLMLQPDELEEARELVREQGVEDRWEFALDNSEAAEALESAAEKARSVESLDEAIDVYINKLEIEKPGTVAGVKKRVKAYRKKATK